MKYKLWVVLPHYMDHISHVLFKRDEQYHFHSPVHAHDYANELWGMDSFNAMLRPKVYSVIIEEEK